MKNRFKFDKDDGDFEQYKQEFIAKNTADNTQKCLRLFNEWKDERNAMFPIIPCYRTFSRVEIRLNCANGLPNSPQRHKRKRDSLVTIFRTVLKCVLSVFILFNQFDSYITFDNEGSYGILARRHFRYWLGGPTDVHTT